MQKNGRASSLIKSLPVGCLPYNRTLDHPQLDKARDVQSSQAYNSTFYKCRCSPRDFFFAPKASFCQGRYLLLSVTNFKLSPSLRRKLESSSSCGVREFPGLGDSVPETFYRLE